MGKPPLGQHRQRIKGRESSRQEGGGQDQGDPMPLTALPPTQCRPPRLALPKAVQQVGGCQRHQQHRRKIVGQDQPGSSHRQHGGIRPPAPDGQAPARPQDQREEDEGKRLGQRPPAIDVGQVVGRVHVGQRSQGGAPPAKRLTGEQVHGKAREKQGGREGQLQGDHGIAHEKLKGRGQVVAERAVKVDDREAVAEGQVGEPAREEDPGAQRLTQCRQSVQVEEPVVRDEKSGAQEGPQCRER